MTTTTEVCTHQDDWGSTVIGDNCIVCDAFVKYAPPLLDKAEAILRNDGPEALAAWEAAMPPDVKARFDAQWRLFTEAMKALGQAGKRA